MVDARRIIDDELEKLFGSLAAIALTARGRSARPRLDGSTCSGFWPRIPSLIGCWPCFLWLCWGFVLRHAVGMCWQALAAG
jgi:hypothetical protein